MIMLYYPDVPRAHKSFDKATTALEQVAYVVPEEHRHVYKLVGIIVSTKLMGASAITITITSACRERQWQQRLIHFDWLDLA
jgi:hypothetical protein